jgi:hypothetical protein
MARASVIERSSGWRRHPLGSHVHGHQHLQRLRQVLSNPLPARLAYVAAQGDNIVTELSRNPGPDPEFARRM